MKILIDGYNLIRCTPLGEAERNGLEAARESVLSLLARYQRLKGHQVVVVFDGPEFSHSRFGPVEVRYAAPADLELKKLAAPGSIVVTSDREVAREAERRGATAVSSEAFWAKLAEAGSTGSALCDPVPAWSKEEDSDDDFRPTSKKGTARRASKTEKRRQAGLKKL